VYGQGIRIDYVKYLVQAAKKNIGYGGDYEDHIITNSHMSSRSSVTHFYLNQRYHGIEIKNAVMGIHIDTSGNLVTLHDQFITGLTSKITSETPVLTPVDAIKSAVTQLNYNYPGDPELISNGNSNDQIFLYAGGSISKENIPVKLMYQPMADDRLHLAWDLSILQIGKSDWWSIRVDALTGEILDKKNLTLNCNFGDHTHEAHGENCIRHNSLNKKSAEELISETTLLLPNSYNVFPLGTESPNHGPRVLKISPHDIIASPYGWHDTNGIAGAEYTTTKGNNVEAKDDMAGDDEITIGSFANGGSNLEFDFPLNFNLVPSANLSAAITNLFYWNNVMHDVWYQYGFTEAAGNFQQNNYGRGGIADDFVYADGLDGSNINNANFATPEDGFNPRMQMFLWTSPGLLLDSDLDNAVIAHEYGHGISTRLTGGAGNSGCLFNDEQMGEGWSDWFGLMLTMNAGDQGTTGRGIATYLLSQPTNGTGLRPYKYSTDMSVNPHTYASIASVAIPHGVGAVWCAMIWDMTWLLIDAHGFNPDYYYGTGGNNIAMALVTEALKLQPCNPGFVDARNAILAADDVLYGGVHKCLIWKAFAKRGLGVRANQGSSDSRSDGSQSFEMPTSCCNQVYITDNSGTGSLRNALSCAANGDTIRFAPFLDGKTIILNGGLTIEKNVFVKCENPHQITLKTIDPVATVTIANNNVELESIKVSGGSNSNGRVVINNGNLKCNNVTFIDELIPSGNGVSIKNNGTLIFNGNNILKKE
jgi:extracellular elastinolytic metalloproteinase